MLYHYTLHCFITTVINESNIDSLNGVYNLYLCVVFFTFNWNTINIHFLSSFTMKKKHSKLLCYFIFFKGFIIFFTVSFKHSTRIEKDQIIFVFSYNNKI